MLWARRHAVDLRGRAHDRRGPSRARARPSSACVLVLAAMAVRFVRAGSRRPTAARSSSTLLAPLRLGLGAVLLYVVQSDLWASAFRQAAGANWPKLSTALSALWPAAWVAAAWPILLDRARLRARWRARRGWSWGASAAPCCPGFGLAAALIAAFSFAYVASERDKKFDLAYFRTTRPGEVTRRIVRNLDQPIEIAVFFPVGERGARRGGQLPRATWPRSPASSRSRTTTSTSTR